MNRRDTLALLGSSIAAGFAGCSAPTRHSGNGGASEVEYDVSDGSLSLQSGSEKTIAVHIHDAETFESLPDHIIDGQEDALSFLNGTDFSRSTVFYVETVAPNACHALHVDSIEIDSEQRVTGQVESRDQSGADEGCPQVIVHPSRLIRVTSTDENPPERGEFEVQDGWGEVETVSTVSIDELDIPVS